MPKCPRCGKETDMPFHTCVASMKNSALEIPFKQWRIEEAQRLGISVSTLNMRLSRGTVPYPPVRRVNKRIVFVKVKP